MAEAHALENEDLEKILFPPIITPHGKMPKCFCEKYTVVDQWEETMCQWAGETPTVDTFASNKNKRFKRFWEKKKIHLSSFGVMNFCG